MIFILFLLEWSYGQILSFSLSRSDEIGRRARLKIWCGSPHVPVRLRPSANKKLSSDGEFFIIKMFFFEIAGVEPEPVLSSRKTWHLVTFCSAEWPSANKKLSRFYYEKYVVFLPVVSRMYFNGSFIIYGQFAWKK